jgi:predicted dehydrogenase
VFSIGPDVCPSPIGFFEDHKGKLTKVDIPVIELRGDALRAYEFCEQAKNFLQCIRDEEPAVNSSSQAVQLMEMLDAVYRSSQLGKEVTIR